MEILELKQRLMKASIQHSLREIADWCDISHEYVRKILLGKSKNLTINVYNKIDNGLTHYGF